MDSTPADLESSKKADFAFIYSLTSSFFGIDSESISKVIEGSIVDTFLTGCGHEPLIITRHDSAIDEDERERKEIVANLGWYSRIFDSDALVLFIKSKVELEETNGMLIPFMWKRGISIDSISYSYINDIMIPLVTQILHTIEHNDPKRYQINDILHKLRETSKSFQLFSSNSSIANADFVICNTLLSLLDSSMKLRDYRVKLDQTQLNDIRVNITEWSLEIVRILSEYSKMNGESESSFTSSEAETSGYSSSSDTDTDSFIQESELKYMNTKLKEHITGTISSFNSNLDPYDEVNFWKTYGAVLVDLKTKVESENFVNTLKLFEYNGFSVETIYCFYDSISVIKERIDRVNEINNFMCNLPIEKLSYLEDVASLKSALDQMFLHLEKATLVKLYKRFIPFMTGLTAKIIKTFSRVTSFELSKVGNSLTHKVLKDILELVYDFCAKLKKLDAQLKGSDGCNLYFPLTTLLEPINIYKNLLKSIKSCQSRTNIINQDVMLFLSYVANGVESFEDEELLNFGEISEDVECHKSLTKLSNELKIKYASFLSEIIKEFSTSSQTFNSAMLITNCISNFETEIFSLENGLLTALEKYLDGKSMDKILRFIDFANEMNTLKKSYNHIKKVIDPVIDYIVEESTNISSSACKFYHLFPKGSEEILSAIFSKEKIKVLLNIIKNLLVISKRGELQELQVILQKILADKRYTECEYGIMDFYADERILEIRKSEGGSFLLSVNPSLKGLPMILKEHIMGNMCNINQEDESKLISLDSLSRLIDSCNALDDEKQRLFSQDTSCPRAILLIENDYNERLYSNIKLFVNITFKNFVHDDDFDKLISSFRDSLKISEYIIGFQNRFQSLIMQEYKCTPSIISYFLRIEDVEMDPKVAKDVKSEVSRSVKELIRECIKYELFQWKNEGIYESIEQELVISNEELCPHISSIRGLMYNKILEIIDSRAFREYGTFLEPMIMDPCFTECISTAETILFSIEEIIQFWSVLTSDWAGHVSLNLVNRKDYIKMIEESNSLFEECMNINEVVKVGSLSIKIPKDLYLKRVDEFRCSVRILVERSVINSSQALANVLLACSKSLGLNVPKSSIIPQSKDLISKNESKSISENFFALDSLKMENCLDILRKRSLDNSELEYISPFEFLQETIKNTLDYVYSVNCSIVNYEAWKNEVDRVRNLETTFRNFGLALPKNWINSRSLSRIIERVFTESNSFIYSENKGTIMQWISELENICTEERELLSAEWKTLISAIDVFSDFYTLMKNISEFELQYSQNMTLLNNIKRIGDMLTCISSSIEKVYVERDEIYTEIISYKSEFMHGMKGMLEMQKLLLSDISSYRGIEEIKELIEGCPNIMKLTSKLLLEIEEIYSINILSYMSENDFKDRLYNFISMHRNDEKNSKEISIYLFLEIYREHKVDLIEIFRYGGRIYSVSTYISGVKEALLKFDFLWIHEEKLDIYIPSNIHKLYDFLNENIISLKIIKESKHSASITESAIHWIDKLKIAKLFLDNWTISCTKLENLKNIFSFQDVQIQLSTGLEKMHLISLELSKIVESLPSVEKITEAHIQRIELILNEIDTVDGMLKVYLEDIRSVFPRFFFIQDEDLLEIISCKNTKDLQKYLFKIFPSMSEFIIGDDRDINGICYQDEESLMFGKSIAFTDINPVNLLKEVDSSIKNTLKNMLDESIYDLNEVYGRTNFEKTLLERWIETFPSQIQVLSISILWTRKMEKIMNEDELNEFRNFISFFTELVLSLIDNVRMQTKIHNLIVLLNYHADKTKQFELGMINSFEWLKCLRYYYDDRLYLKLCMQSYEYGFEYIGAYKSLVITPITERCFISMSLAQKYGFVGNPQGPAGTGKTESIKALASLCGYNSIVFNCSDSFDSYDMEKIFSGLCRLGYWGIFDEFNRLDELVLSSITETMLLIYGQKNKDITLFNKKLKVNPSTSVFVTMNPGYLSRSVLPLNTRLICHPFIMDSVNIFHIIRINFMLSGFENSDGLSQNFKMMLDACNLVLVGRRYDFGLRCIKSIFSCINYLKMVDFEWTIVDALLIVIAPRLNKDDASVFKYILSRFFPEQVPNSQINDTYKSVLKSFGIKDSYINSKAVEILQLERSSNAIILLGQSGTGKSTALNIAVKLIKIINGIDYEIIRFDPDANELYEYFHKKMYDGLFSSILRSYCGTNKHVFIVFDGYLDSKWIENLNTLLDDTRILTLSNGDRIHLTDNIRIIFETDSLDNITAATVSRCALISFDPINEDLNYALKYGDFSEKYFDLVRSRMNQLPLFKSIMESLDQSFNSLIFSFVNAFGLQLEEEEFDDFVKMVNKKVAEISGLVNFDYYSIEQENFKKLRVNTRIELVRSFIENCKPIVLRGNNPCESLVKILPDEYQSITIYMQNGYRHLFLIEHLLRNCNMDDSKGKLLLSPKSGKRLLVFIRDLDRTDVDIIKGCLFPTIRHISKFGYLFMFDQKSYKWVKVYVENVSFVFIADNLPPSRFAQNTPIVWINDGILRDFEKEFEENNLGNFGSSIICYGLLKETLSKISRFLSSKRAHLSIIGPACSGKRLLLHSISKGSYEFAYVDSMEKFCECIKDTTIGMSKYLICVNWDLLSLKSPYDLFLVKNIILNGDYTLAFNLENMEKMYEKCATEGETLDCFITKLNTSACKNIKVIFISSHNDFDTSILRREFNCKTYKLDHESMAQIGNSIYNIKDRENIMNIIIEIFSEYMKKRTVSHFEFIVFVKIFKEVFEANNNENWKRLEHLKTGIEKIRESKIFVDDMGKLLDKQKSHLKRKNEEVEAKMKLMVEKQSAREESRKRAIELSLILEKEKKELNKRKREVKSQLDEVLPLLESAKKDVENINRKSLDELRSMANPPSIIKYAIKIVAMILSDHTSNISWDEARKVLKNSDFITKVLTFNIENVSKSKYKMMIEETSKEEWDITRICKASKAAGPLAKWVSSLIASCQISTSVNPLKKEIKNIKSEYLKNEQMLKDQNSLISAMEMEIERYKKEYAELVLSVSSISSEIEVIESKLSRSKCVLNNLSHEIERWNKTVEMLEKNSEYILGDSLLESSQTLLVKLDKYEREALTKFITDILHRCEILHSLDFDRVDIERSTIEKNMKHRHCIILDSQEFLYKNIVGDKCTVISACDSNFIAVLRSVKQFGSELVITDLHCSDTQIKNIILSEFEERANGYESDQFYIYLVLPDYSVFLFEHKTEDDYLVYCIYNRAIVINMKLSRQYFEVFCRDRIMEYLEPELHLHHKEYESKVKELKKSINCLENKLLNFLMNVDDLLDSSSLLFLENHKRSVDELGNRVNSFISADETFFSTMDSYTEYASLLSDIYNAMTSIKELNIFYVFDLNIIFYAMKMSYGKDAINCMMRTIYKWVDQGLFMDDKLHWRLEMLHLYNKYNLNSEQKNDFKLEAKELVMDCADEIFTRDESRFDCEIFSYYDTVFILVDGMEDPFIFVESFSKRSGKKLKVHAMGSISELERIEESMNEALNNGDFVFLKNAHLVPFWTKTLESKFVNKRENSKLFLEWDLSVPLPDSLLSKCCKIVYQGSRELKNILLYLLSYMVPSDSPRLIRHLSGRAILVHAISLYRQFIPHGWTLNYALDEHEIKITIKETISLVGDIESPDQNVVNEWKKRVFNVYSSKISENLDLCILSEIIDFTDPNIYQFGLQYDNMEEWIRKLPEKTTPSMVGLINWPNIDSNPPCDKTEDEPKYTETPYYEPECKIFEKCLSREIAYGYKSKNHKTACDMLYTFANNRKSIKINFDYFTLPDLLMKSLKFAISNANNCSVHSILLYVAIDKTNGHEFSSNGPRETMQLCCVKLCNGFYDYNENTIRTSDSDQPVSLVYTWFLETDEPIHDENKQKTIELPLYNSKG